METAGLNTIKLEYSAENREGQSMISNCLIRQSAPKAYPTLRHHYIEILVCYYSEDNLSTETYQFVIEPSEITHVDILVGKPQPSFIFINNGDHAFAKSILDDKSLDFVEKHLSLFDDPFLRQMLWCNFYNAVRDGMLSSKKYINLVSKHIGHETDLKLVETIINTVAAAANTFVPNKFYYTEFDLLFEMAMCQYSNDNLSSAQCIIWEKAIILFGQSKSAVKRLLTTMCNQSEPSNNFCQASTWTIIEKAIAWDFPQAPELLNLEIELDSSDIGRRAALMCATSKPDPIIKQKAWNRFINAVSDLSNHERSAEMHGFRWFNQSELLAEYKLQFFNSVRDIFQMRSREFANSFARNLFPFDSEDPDIIQLTSNLLAERSPEEKYLSHFLCEQLDDLQRAAMCRSAY